MWRAWVAVGMAGVALAGCGGGDDDTTTAEQPPRTEAAVATVGSIPVTEEELDRVAQARWPGLANDLGLKDVPWPAPPDHAACVRDVRARGLTVDGGLVTEPAEICAQARQQALQDALSGLITANVVVAEAREQGVDLSPAAIDRVWEDEWRDAYQSRAGLEAYVEQSGITEEELRRDAYLEVLQRRLSDHYVQEVAGIDVADMRRYHRRHPEDFVVPDKWRVASITFDERREAERARKRLEAGEPWLVVYLDEHPEGGPYSSYLGSIERPSADVRRAMEKAPVGKVVGPVPELGGWTVFEVLSHVPEGPAPFEESREPLTQKMLDPGEKEQLMQRFQAMQEVWRLRTSCEGEVVVPSCGNAPAGAPVAP